MPGSYQTKEKAVESAQLIGQHLQARRQSLYAIQWFFYSGFACLYPYLYSTYASDLGLNAVERTFAQIVATTARVLIIGPCIYWRFHVHTLRKAKHVLVLSLILVVGTHLSLLAIPRTIRTARQPRVSLNCSRGSGLLRVEQCNNAISTCPPMGRQSLSLASSVSTSGSTGSTSGVSFSTFSLGLCRKVCASQLGWSLGRVALSTQHQPLSLHHQHHQHQDQTQSPLNSFGASLAGQPNSVRVCFHPPDHHSTFAHSAVNQPRCYLFDPNLIDASQDHADLQVNHFDPYVENIQFASASPSSSGSSSSASSSHTNVTLRRTNRLQFHSKTDAWISISRKPHVPTLLHPYASCVYTQNQPVFVDGDSFERITCFDASTDSLSSSPLSPMAAKISLTPSSDSSESSPLFDSDGTSDQLQASIASAPSSAATSLDQCESLCNVNFLQRTQHPTQAVSNGHTVSVHPTLCEQVQGDPMLTFILFSTLRVFADCCLLLAHLTLITLHTYHKSNLQLLHGGLSRFISFGTATAIWPAISGLLLHMYSNPPQFDYAPCFLMFAGHTLVSAALSTVLPLGPSFLELQATLNSRHASNLYLADQIMYSDRKRQPKQDLTTSCCYLSKTHINQHLNQSNQSDSSGDWTNGTQIKPKNGSLIRKCLQSTFGLFAFAVIQSSLVSLYHTQLPVYLLSIGHSRLWIAISESVCWSVYSAFSLSASTCLSTIGKKVWLLLGITFHVLLLSAISATYEASKWQLIAFALMRSFAFPLSMMALSALIHSHTPRPRAQHIHVQLWLQYIQFAVGSMVAAFVSIAAQVPRCQMYLQHITPQWLRLRSVDLLSSKSPTIMLLDQVNSFRLLCRLLAVGLILLLLASICIDLLWNVCARVCTYDLPPESADKQSRIPRDHPSSGLHHDHHVQPDQRQALLSHSAHNPLMGIKMIDEGDDN